MGLRCTKIFSRRLMFFSLIHEWLIFIIYIYNYELVWAYDIKIANTSIIYIYTLLWYIYTYIIYTFIYIYCVYIFCFTYTYRSIYVGLRVSFRNSPSHLRLFRRRSWNFERRCVVSRWSSHTSMVENFKSRLLQVTGKIGTIPSSSSSL